LLRPLALALATAAGLAQAVESPQQSPSLCSPAERILFACIAEGKIHSVCASANLSRSVGYLQYRVGRDPLTIDLEYPNRKIHPRGSFAFAFRGDSARASTKELLFVAAGRRHVVRAFTSTFSSGSFGVEITSPDGNQQLIPCNPLPIPYERLLKLQSLDLALPNLQADGPAR
jgi:hypothetical protein